MQVETAHLDGAVHLRVRGEVDIAVVEHLARAIDDAVRHGRPLVIDLRATSFLGLCALEPITEACRQLGDDAGVTVLVGSALHRHLLAMSGLDSMATIEGARPSSS